VIAFNARARVGTEIDLRPRRADCPRRKRAELLSSLYRFGSDEPRCVGHSRR
jgi:hypothetical protein